MSTGAAFARSFVLGDGDGDGVRCRVLVDCVIAKDAAGFLHHKYESEVIPSLHPEQEWWIEAGLVQAIESPAEQAQPTADSAQPMLRKVSRQLDDDLIADSVDHVDHVDHVDRLDECMTALALLRLPLDAGAPAARTALRESSYSFGNDIIAAAIRARREKVSRTHAES